MPVADAGIGSQDTGLRAQSLATGAAGTALLAIELALAGSVGWDSAARAIRLAAAGDLDASDRAGLYYGAPAIRFIFHTAQADGLPRYQQTTRILDRHITRLTHRRLDEVAARQQGRGQVVFRDYDVFCGLTGLAALLLRTTPGNDALGRILTYLTALTEPRRNPDGTVLPGWWVSHDPDPTLPSPGGHANFGMAHGAAGILALLAFATARGAEVPGQRDAIERLTAVFGTWRQDGPAGPWWPQWVTRAEWRTGRPARQRPSRVSWCYGAAGITRALQLAAIATADPILRRQAEHDLAECLADTHLAQLTDAGLCHGIAGIYQTTLRAVHDAATPALAARLPALAGYLTRQAMAPGDQAGGLLTGRTGTALALMTARSNALPRSGWDACLLIT